MATRNRKKSVPETKQQDTEAPAPERGLHDVDVLDMRDMSLMGRCTVLSYISDLGYLWSDLRKVMHTPDDLNTQFLAFNHVNRLIESIDEEQAKNLPLTTVDIQPVKIKFEFSAPDFMYPPTLEVGGATYARIA